MDIYDQILECLELERELGTRTVEIDRALLVPPKKEVPLQVAATAEAVDRTVSEPRQEATARVETAPVSVAAVDKGAAKSSPQDVQGAVDSGSAECLCDIAFFTGRTLSDRGNEAMRKTFAAMQKIRPGISVRLNERCKAKVVILLGSDAMLKRMPTARPVRGAWVTLDGTPAIMTYSPDFIFSHFQEGSPNMNKAKHSMWSDIQSAIARL